MNRLPIRGANWNNGSNAGLAALNLNNPRSNANSNIGGRPALGQIITLTYVVDEKDVCTAAKAETVIHNAPDASGATLYNQIIAKSNLYLAAKLCRRGKAKTKGAIAFFNNLDTNIEAIYQQLQNKLFVPSEYKHFYVFEPKRRLISAPTFSDRVVHRAIYNILYPIYDTQFIYDSYACRINKGTHRGANRAQAFINKYTNKKPVYVLKADIYHYFSSIDHHILKALLTRRIKCSKTLELLDIIIDSSPSDEVGVGIPLGNLTSQLFANVYLHELDFYVKHTIKYPHYIRYMDDFVFIGDNKQQLHKIKSQVINYLEKNLRLQTNNKTQVFPIHTQQGRALDFLGYRIYATHRLLRKSSVKRIKTKLKYFQSQYALNNLTLADINPSIQSWLGHAKHANTYNLRCKIFNSLFKRD